MISREQIHELAQFEDHESCALSFYFQPTSPRNKAHKEETILTKDLAREALRQLESKRLEGKGKDKGREKDRSESARADIERIVRLSQNLRGNGVHAKAVFACSARGFWRSHQATSACLNNVGRAWEYGLNYYAGHPFHACSGGETPKIVVIDGRLAVVR